ncbi:YqgE/AlgH family protein [Nocardia sp. NPDC051030]|uniref:YqgE/AlgH family protein n=1 Tax=Nocardia sp. NPDC051030 TaxID=3155162 RepID=UPI0034197321
MARAEEHGDHSRREFRHQDQVVRPGTLLVSATDLDEPTFRRTVIYIIEHNEGGSHGVVLNRPSETAVHEVLPNWTDLVAVPRALYIGGPVGGNLVRCLATLKVGADVRPQVDGLRRVDGRVALVDLDSDPDRIAPLIEGLRIFVGYSGWTFGQLEGELDRGDWIVLSALPTDLLAGHVDLWAHVLRRQPLPLRLLATHPIEIDRN